MTGAQVGRRVPRAPAEVAAAVRRAVETGELDAAKRALLAPDCGVKCVETWTSVIKAMAKEGKQRGGAWRGGCMLEMLEVMKARRIHQSQHVYSMVLTALVAGRGARRGARNGDLTAAWEAAVELFKGDFAQTRRNAFAWSCLFTAYGRLQLVGEIRRAYAWLKRSGQDAGVALDAPLLASIVTAFSRARAIPEGLAALRDQQGMGLGLQGAAVTALLHACLEDGARDQAKEVLATARADGTLDFARFLPLAVRLLCRTGAEAAAFSDEHSRGLAPSVFTGLVHVCIDDRDLPSALRVLRAAPHPPDALAAFSVAMTFAAATGSFEQVMSVFAALPPGAADRGIYNNLLKAHCAMSRPGVLQLVDRMDAEGVERTHHELKLAVRNCEACEEFADAETILRMAEREQIVLRATLC
eukprot:TRINITY_DN2288_c0_g1_i1.p1 TRINITY_DN2288_c0_g1~~TRINITY_DN2288_c0_g1_i1.p1  ORF type:complete len:414 (+),score=103.11 TRINITY_DN2288_c0_g1_i1:125-1366(+)